VPSVRGVKMSASLKVATVRLLVFEGMKGAEIHRQVATKYGHTYLSH
jgi:hypothetical protein